jgi:hypothetical protein
MKAWRKAAILKAALVALSLLVNPAGLFAQCPLCYRAAASAGGRFIEALRSGILILLPAPFVFAGVIAFLAYRKRNTYADDPADSGIAG